MNILIVEDELLIAEMLKEMLEELGHTVVAVCKNYMQAIVCFEKNTEIDFCFLDINLKEDKNGFDIATIIKGKIQFAFLTSYADKENIGLAMQYEPQAYMLKPFTELDLFVTLELVKSKNVHLPTNPEKSIVIKDGHQTIKILEKDILWLKADNVYVELKTVSKVYLLRMSMIKFFEEYQLPSLIRTHRAFAVNINNISAISGQQIIIGDNRIPISRNHKDELLEKFKN